MNDRFRNDRGRSDQSNWRGNDSDRSRTREASSQGGRGQSQEPFYSSDEDETLGSEWDRERERGARFDEREERYGQQGGSARYGQSPPRYGQGGGSPGGSSSGSGFYNRGNAGMYGGGSGGGYVGGRGGSGYGGSTGTDYGGGSYGGYAGNQSRFGGDQGGYGGTQGSNFGAGSTRGDGQVAWGGSSNTTSRSTGGFAGRGPKGYTRTDDRIREDVCDRLSADDDVDASEIEVRVQNGEVTLAGTVSTRSMKHQAENLADEVAGVNEVHNQLRVLKGMLTEIKDKLTGEDKEQHYANTGTKTKVANGTV